MARCLMAVNLAEREYQILRQSDYKQRWQVGRSVLIQDVSAIAGDKHSAGVKQIKNQRGHELTTLASLGVR
jgi:hypothetical protein